LGATCFAEQSEAAATEEEEDEGVATGRVSGAVDVSGGSPGVDDGLVSVGASLKTEEELGAMVRESVE